MVKRVYLLVSDLHLSTATKENRINYGNEMLMLKIEILKLINSYNNKGFLVNVIFLGDLFDRGYRDSLGCTLDQNFFIMVSLRAENVYCVVGNHEITYSIGNPFYTLFSKVDSTKMSFLQPEGLSDWIKVVDTVEDGNLVIHFNHYGSGISEPVPGKVNVGLGHHDACCTAVVKDAETTFGFDVFDGYMVKVVEDAFFAGYQYYYIAHFHKLYGAYTVDTLSGECKLRHLASLGRPHHDEVQDNFLERDIPALVVEDGVFQKEEHNFIYLPSRGNCIKENVVRKQQANRQRAKQMRKASNYSFNEDRPVGNIRQVLLEDVGAREILESVLTNKKSEQLAQLDKEISEVCNGW